MYHSLESGIYRNGYEYDISGYMPQHDTGGFHQLSARRLAVAFYPGASPSLRHEGNVRRLRAEPELLQVVTAAMTVLTILNNSVRNMAFHTQQISLLRVCHHCQWGQRLEPIWMTISLSIRLTWTLRSTNGREKGRMWPRRARGNVPSSWHTLCLIRDTIQGG